MVWENVCGGNGQVQLIRAIKVPRALLVQSFSSESLPTLTSNRWCIWKSCNKITRDPCTECPLFKMHGTTLWFMFVITIPLQTFQSKKDGKHITSVTQRNPCNGAMMLPIPSCCSKKLSYSAYFSCQYSVANSTFPTIPWQTQDPDFNMKQNGLHS